MANKVVSTTLLARGTGVYQAKMAQASAANARFGASAVGPSAKAKTLQSRIGGVAGSAGLLNPALLGAAGAVVAIKSVVGAAVEWESAFTGVEKTVEGTTEQLAGIESGLRDLSTEIPVTAGELAGIAESAGQLGIETDNVIGFTRVIADLGVATDMTSEQAATALARFANITQMPQGDFDRLGSTLVDLGNNSATTESEIAEMSLRLAAASDQAGLSEAEILGLSAALSSVGIRAEAGGTAFSKVMIEISEAAANGGEQLDKLADVAGMSSDAFANLFAEDPAEAVIRFVEGLGSASDAGENLFGILGDLGIEEIRMRDALLRTAGAGDVLRDSVERGNEAWGENIALTEEAGRRYETTASQWQIFTNQIKDAATSLGEIALPAVNDILQDLNETMETGIPGSSDGVFGTLIDVLTAPLNLPMLRAWVDQMRGGTQAGQDLRAAWEQPFGITDAEEDFLRVNGQLGDMRGLSGGAAAGIGEVGDALDDAELDARTATQALEGYIDWLRRATDPVFNLLEAVVEVDEAEKAYNKTVDEYGETSAEATEAALTHLRALDRLETAAIDGDLSFADFSSRLDGFVESGDLTAEAADLIRIRVAEARGETERFDGEYVANLIAQTETAEERLRRVNTLIASIPSRIRTEVFLDSSSYSDALSTPGIEARAHGGPVSAGHPYLVGEKRPEVFVPDTSGTILPNVTGSMLAGSRTGTSQPVNITLQMDGRTIVRSRGFIDELGKYQATAARNVAA